MTSNNPLAANSVKLLMPAHGAVLFDMDGVLVDSAGAHYRAWSLFAGRRGIQLSESRFREEIFGRRNLDVLRDVVTEPLSDKQLELLSVEKEQIYRDSLNDGLDTPVGCLEFVELLQSQGLRLGLTSSAPRLNVETVIRLLGLEDTFGAVVSSEDVSRGKPDPEAYATTALRLSCAGERCLVIEDTPDGIRSAIGAGAVALGISTTHAAAQLLDSGAACVVNTFQAFARVLVDPERERPAVVVT